VVVESFYKYLPTSPTNRLIKVYLRLDNIDIDINIYIEVLLKI